VREHGKTASRAARPSLLRLVPIQLDAIAVRVPEINGLANAVICRALERDGSFQDAAQGFGQLGPSWIQDGDMVKAGRAGRRRLTTGAFPSIEPDVMVVTTGGQERCLRAESLRDLETKHIAIEYERAFQIGYLQMNVPDADLRVSGVWMRFSFHEFLSHCSPLVSRRATAVN
jgi:hypothetical protein